jgi:hypothetical protein
MDQPVEASNPNRRTSHFADVSANEVRHGKYQPQTVSIGSGYGQSSDLTGQPQGQPLHSGPEHTTSRREENDQNANRVPSLPVSGAHSAEGFSRSEPMIEVLNTRTWAAPSN